MEEMLEGDRQTSNKLRSLANISCREDKSHRSGLTLLEKHNSSLIQNRQTG